MEPYVIEIICKPADKNSPISFCHATVCAIAKDSANAEIMAKNLVMSYSYVVESVEGVALKSALPHDDNSMLEEALYQKALQRKSLCALQLVASNEDLSAVAIHSLNSPKSNETIN